MTFCDYVSILNVLCFLFNIRNESRCTLEINKDSGRNYLTLSLLCCRIIFIKIHHFKNGIEILKVNLN